MPDDELQGPASKDHLAIPTAEATCSACYLGRSPVEFFVAIGADTPNCSNTRHV